MLTLTASPIPRTLEMSLTGIRDLSLITTPPSERQPILTYVGEQDERAVAEAIRRELLREGQIFYVHNRVQDIERVAADLRELVPDARIAVAHGQMDEGSLEQVVLDFWEGDYDVLVCTTIIESGIDMPSVNTLVVDRADRLGLGQLHQLRGRVGRAGRRAYAYLLFPPDRVLSEQAYERLRTIGEHTELGSGFKIAMRDLEIRGAGNLLGSDQSGHIAAVGYDLYVRLVAEAVSELKGEPVRVPVEITVDLPVDAFLPPDYVEREDLRLEAYRRLAEVRDPAAVEDLRTEWLDRYGPLPPEAEALVAVGRLRAECVRTGVTEVTASITRPGAGGPGRTGEAVARIAPVRLRASARVRLTRLHPRAIVKDEVDQIIVPLPAGPDLADRLADAARRARPRRAGRRRPSRPRRRGGCRRRGGGGWLRPASHPYDLRTVKRLSAALAGLVALAVSTLGLSGCNVRFSPYAAVVNGSEVSQTQMQDALSAIAANAGYRCTIEAGGTSPVFGAGDGTYNAAFSAEVLSILIQDKVVGQDLVRLGLPEPASLQPVALAQVEAASTPATGCSGTGASVIAAFPSSYRQQLIRFQVDEDVLAAHLAGTTLTAGGLAAYAASHRAATTLACVSVIVVETKATAAALRSRIVRGASFAALAKAHSIDTSTAPKGGALGCIPDCRVQRSPQQRRGRASDRTGLAPDLVQLCLAAPAAHPAPPGDLLRAGLLHPRPRSRARSAS